MVRIFRDIDASRQLGGGARGARLGGDGDRTGGETSGLEYAVVADRAEARVAHTPQHAVGRGSIIVRGVGRDGDGLAGECQRVSIEGDVQRELRLIGGVGRAAVVRDEIDAAGFASAARSAGVTRLPVRAPRLRVAAAVLRVACAGLRARAARAESSQQQSRNSDERYDE